MAATRRMYLLRAKNTIISFLILLPRLLHVLAHSDSKALSELVEELFNEPRYNSRARPGSDTGEPLPVYININVNDISSISEMKMEYSMTLYLRQIWRDKRLTFNSARNVTLHHKQFDRMWTPDVFIRNLKAGVFHQITVPNRLIRLSPDGTVLYSQRLTLTLACDMILNKYPMDNQTCNIELGSYAYTTEDLIFYWRTDAKPVEYNVNISLPEYDLKAISHIVCTQTINSTGSFPCLRAHFHLERRLRAYVLSTFLPSMLVVLLSWVSFWIDLESVPARISLGILTMLTITTQSSGHLRGMPAASLTKAIDVWMATCLVFVFGSFIEYSIVNVLARREKHRASSSSSSSCSYSSAPSYLSSTVHHPPSSTTLKNKNNCYSSVQDTDVLLNVNNYSPCRLFRRRPQRGLGETQEMIPLTNVQHSGDESSIFQHHQQQQQLCCGCEERHRIVDIRNHGVMGGGGVVIVSGGGGRETGRGGGGVGPGRGGNGVEIERGGGGGGGGGGVSGEGAWREGRSGSSLSVHDDVGRDGGGEWKIRSAGGGQSEYGWIKSLFRCCRSQEEYHHTSRPVIRPKSTQSKYSQALMVDMISRVLFPFMFLIFNGVYWPYYLWN